MGRIYHRQVLGGDEEDALTAWRSMYCYLQRAKTAKKIKHRANKRERRTARQWIKEDLDGTSTG